MSTKLNIYPHIGIGGLRIVSPTPDIPTRSYVVIEENGERTEIDFAVENTPITNFQTRDSSGNFLPLVVNGQTLDKDNVREVHFGDSYSNVTSVDDHFLEGCTSLTSLDLSPLSNVTSIGYGFLTDCDSLTTLDLSPLTNLTSIGGRFLPNCKSLTSLDLSGLTNLTSVGYSFLTDCISLTSLDLSGLTNLTSIGVFFMRQMSTVTELKMGALTPPTLGSNAFHQTTIQSILVPQTSVAAYKSATNWSDKSTIISGY